MSHSVPFQNKEQVGEGEKWIHWIASETFGKRPSKQTSGTDAKQVHSRRHVLRDRANMVLLVRLQVRERIGCAMHKDEQEEDGTSKERPVPWIDGVELPMCIRRGCGYCRLQKMWAHRCCSFHRWRPCAMESMSRRALDVQVLGLERCHLGPNFRSLSDVVLVLVFAYCVPPLLQASYIVPQTTDHIFGRRNINIMLAGYEEVHEAG